MKVLGVDPGVRGGLAIVDIDNGVAPQIIDVIDIPVAGIGAKERVDGLAIRTWISTTISPTSDNWATRCLVYPWWPNTLIAETSP
jgi:hypothetical protein